MKMDINSLLLYALFFYAFVIILEIVLRFKMSEIRYDWQEAISNMGCGIVQQLGDLACRFFILPLYLYLYEFHRFFEIQSSYLNLALLFVMRDFVYYWVHRFSHLNKFFWGIHLVHHQPKRYNFTVGLRMPLFHYLTDISYIIIFSLLGFSYKDYMAVTIVWASLQILSHTELIKKEIPIIKYVLVTPAHHQIHHGKNGPYRDKNFAGIFSIFDYLFGTRQGRSEGIPLEFGVVEDNYDLSPLEANTVYWFKNKKDYEIGKKNIFKNVSLLVLIILSSELILRNNNLNVHELLFAITILLLMFFIIGRAKTF